MTSKPNPKFTWLVKIDPFKEKGEVVKETGKKDNYNQNALLDQQESH